MKINQVAYSYKSDKSVPDFRDSGPVTVMDANCSLCARGAMWIARNDKAGEFRIIPLQSDRGAALMEHYDMNPSDPTSWLYIVDGRAYTSLDAFIRVGNRLGGIWRILTTLRIMPTVIQDFFYSLIARNRYKVFGKTDLCSIPDSEVKKRLLL